MKIPDPYFAKAPLYGDLYMEQILVEYDYPLLSVLQDKVGGRYLCICFDTRGSQQWIVAPIKCSTLINLLRNELSLVDAFKISPGKSLFATRDYATKDDSFQLLTSKDIPEVFLPAAGELLDAENGEWEDYIQKLF